MRSLTRMVGLAVVLVGVQGFSGLAARADDVGVVSCCCANLDDVRAQPQAWLWTEFCFEGRFARLSEIYQPFFTRFDAYDFANFAAWDQRRDVSVQSDYVESFPLLYLSRRSGSQIEHLFCLKQFQRFRATAVVRNIFDGKPFIEVIDIVPIEKCCSLGGTLGCIHVPRHCAGCDANGHSERLAGTELAIADEKHESTNVDGTPPAAATAVAEPAPAEETPAADEPAEPVGSPGG